MMNDVRSLCISTMCLFNFFLVVKNNQAGAAGEGEKKGTVVIKQLQAFPGSANYYVNKRII